MWEEFTNNFTTPLHTTVNSVTTNIIPNSEAGAPSATPFRIIIDNEIILITSGLGTGTWHGLRGYEGTVAAGHTAGATIQHLLTAGMLQFLRDRMPVVDIYKYGAVGDAATDNKTKVQNCLNDAHSTYPNGFIAMMGRPGDVFYYGSGVNIPDHTILWNPWGVKHLRNYSSANPLFNQQASGRGSHIAILGLGTFGALNSTMIGPIFYIQCDDLWLQDYTVDQFYADPIGNVAGQAHVIGGDRIRILTVKTINPGNSTGNGAMRVVAGRNGRAIGCHIESGDDALQFVPTAPSTGSSYADQTIEDWYYIGCTAISLAARGMVALLADPGAVGSMTDSIIDCGWTDCSVQGGHRGVVIQNTDSTGTIRNVGCRGGSIDCSANVNPTNEEVWIDNGANVYGGTVQDVYIKTRIKHPYKKNIRVSNGVDGVVIDVPGLERPAAGGLQYIEVDICSRARLRLGKIDGTGATTDIILIGSGSNQANDVVLEDTQILNVPATQNAINANNVIKPVIRRCVLSGAGNGIRLGSSSSLGEIYDNDLTGISGTKINDGATDTIKYRNRGDTPMWWPPGYGFTALATNFDFTNTSSVLTVNAMGVPVVNTGYYRVRGVFIAQGDTAADIRLSISAPGSSVWLFDAWDGLVTTATAVTGGHNSPGEVNATPTTTGVNFALLAVPVRIVFDGYLQVLASGNITPKVQQNVQTVVTCTLLAGSYIEAQRVA